MEQDFKQEQKYLRAKRKVEELKGYYWHLAVYIIVNTFISARKIYKSIEAGSSFEEAFFDWKTYIVWLLWGIPFAFHSFRIWGFNLFLGKDWEERKIKEFMNEK